jgi:hypothetical protein
MLYTELTPQSHSSGEVSERWSIGAMEYWRDGVLSDGIGAMGVLSDGVLGFHGVLGCTPIPQDSITPFCIILLRVSISFRIPSTMACTMISPFCRVARVASP